MLSSLLSPSKLANPHERFIPIITDHTINKSVGTTMPDLFARFPSTVKKRQDINCNNYNLDQSKSVKSLNRSIDQTESNNNSALSLSVDYSESPQKEYFSYWSNNNLL